MFKSRFLLFKIFACFTFLQGNAQNELNIRFGKISVDDFQVAAPKFDSGANAVYLSDVGKTSFEGNGHGFFSITYTRSIRIKILNKNGYDGGEFEIPLYNDKHGTFEKISNLKGSTFNLKNGAIQEAKLDDKSVFTERRSKIYDQVKFSMPALEPGSIIDLVYTIKSSNFSDPPTWTFQKNFPCLWSEYDVTIPPLFHYLVKTAGDGQFDIKTNTPVQQTFLIRNDAGTSRADDVMTVPCTSSQIRWVKKNVPSVKLQPFLSTINNYVPRIFFELNYFQQSPEYNRQMEMGNWITKSGKLLASEDFGQDLDQKNTWMNEPLKEILQNTNNREDEIKSIYQFVRNNFHCTDYDEKYIQTSLKDVFTKKTGNVAEINLLLIAMLRHINVTADPVILSTRDNGLANINLPLLYEYNYVICAAQNENKTILLDASQPANAYGKLPSYCYNWDARAINEKFPYTLQLSPDSITENKLTVVIFSNDEKGNYTGRLKTTYGTNESFEIRNKVKEKSEKEYLKATQSSNDNFAISNKGFDSLEKPDQSLILHCDIEAKDLETKDIVYFTPVLAPSIKTNPFTDAERLYPIEMTSKIDYTYILNMEIPKGFKIDELPKSERVNFNENEGLFEYLIQPGENNIQMRVHLKFNYATFPRDEYNTLREFYAYVVKKESQQIVFKKI